MECELTYTYTLLHVHVRVHGCNMYMFMYHASLTYKYTHTHIHRSKNLRPLLPRPLDSDREVSRERRKVGRGEGKDGILTLDNLTKVYGHNSCSCTCCGGGAPDKIAVNQLCLIMRKAEVSNKCISASIAT